MTTRGFCTIPESATRVWSLRDVTLSSEPSSSRITDTTYQSPIRELKLTTQFVSERALHELPYLVDDDAFLPEWDFAQESWDELISQVTAAVTEYNKKVIERAKSLGLSSANVVGKARTDITPSSQSSSIPILRQDSRTEAPIRDNRVETVYEPTIRSTSTRRSSRVKLSPLQAWIAGQRR
jgi:hypothetical protein